MTEVQKAYAEWRDDRLPPHDPNSLLDCLVEDAYRGGFLRGINEALLQVRDAGGEDRELKVTINAMDAESFEKYVREHPESIRTR